ncbi:MAG: hypothetical protein WD648_00270 [Planctomycetaceae bacterium]
MASTVEVKPPQQYVEFDEYIEFQVQKTRASIRLTDILTAIAGIATFVVGYLIVFSVLDHWVVEGGFTQHARGLMLAAVLCVSVGWLAWKAVIPGLRTVSRLFAAREIERSTPDLKSNLLNLIDLQGAGREVPESIQSAMEKRAAMVLSQVNVDHVVDRSMLMRLSYALLAAVIVLCAYTLLSPKQISLARALVPFSSEGVATQTEIFDVKPGDAEVLVRTQLEVTADLRGEVPDGVQILFTTADRRYVDEPVQMHPIEDEQKRYRGAIIGENGRGILQDLSYKVVAGDAVTRDFQVIVLQPPSAAINAIRYNYPDYTELESRTRPSGHIDALEGTIITLTATASTPVRSAAVEFSDERGTSFAAENIPMTITSGTQLRAEWILKIVDKVSPQFYRIHVVGRNGASDPNPLRYNIVVRPDLPPEVALLDPTRDLEMPGNGVVPLLARAQDPDFAVKEVRLRIEKAGEIINRGDPPLFDGKKRNVVLKHDLKLSPLGLQAGDVVTYWVEARDNKSPYANAAASQRLNIRIGARAPNEQVAEQLKADHERQQEKLKEAEEQREKQAADKQDQPGENASKDKQDKQQPQEQQPQPGADGEQAADSDSQTEKGADSENPKPAEQGKNAPKPGGPEGGKEQEKGNKPGDTQAKENEKSDPSSEADDEKVLEEVLKKYGDKADKKDQPAGNQDDNEKPQPGADEKPQPGDSNDNDATGQDENDTQQPKQQPGDNKPEQGGAKQDPSKQQEEDKQQSRDSNKQDSDGGKDREKRDSAGKGPADKPPGERPSQDKDRNHGDDLKKQDSRKDGDKPDQKNADDEQDKEGNEPPKTKRKDDPKADDGKAKSEPAGGQGEPSQGGENQSEKDKSPKSESPGDKTNPAEPAPKDDPDAKDATKSGDSTNGKREPAEDSPDARQEKARGDEKGTGTPEKDPKTEPTPSKGDVKRKEDAAPGATRPGKKDDRKKPAVKSPSKDKSPDETKSSPKSASKDKSDGDQPANSKNDRSQHQPREGSPKQADKQSPDKQTDKAPANRKSTDPTKAPSGDAPPKNDNDQSPPGTPGEKSDGPTKPGEASESPPSQSGQKANEGGQDAKQKQESGQPGQEGGSQAKEGDGEGESDKGGQEKGGTGGSSTKGGQPGKPGPRGGGGAGQGGDQPTRGGGDGPGKAAGTGDEGTGNEGTAPGQPASDDANLESARKATNLVLKQLQRELQRGEVDKDWLKKNGWSEEALQKFAERLQRQLEAPEADNSPQEQARRRQFEEMIKNINITSKGRKREGSSKFDRESEGLGSRRIDAPPEYREWYEAYVQELLKRQKTAKTAK